MENLIKQIRVKLIGAEEDNQAGLGGSRDQKIPIQKTPSFREKKTAQNWIQSQRQLLSRKMSHDYDSTEIEHATAIAAAAFAVSSQFSEIPQKKKRSDQPPETSFTRTTSKVDGKKTPISQLAGAVSKRLSGSFKITDEQDNKVPTSPTREEKKPESSKKTPTFSENSKRAGDKKPDIPAPKKTPTFGDQQHFINTGDAKPETPKPKVPQLVDPTASLRPPPPPPPPPQSPIRQTSTPARPSTRPGTTETKADAWEREEHRKIKERYEKLLETIGSWEKRKKMKARRKLNKHEQSESERKRAKARRKYEAKIKYIDEIAAGARAQADERRRNEALKAKEKANKIRTTGKLPGPCSCF